MTKLTPAVLAITLLAGASGAAMAQDRDHDRGVQAAPQQPHQGPPGGGHWQGGAPGGQPGGQPAAQPGGPPGGGHHWDGGQGGAGRWQGGPPGGQPGGQHVPGGDHRFQGGPAPVGQPQVGPPQVSQPQAAPGGGRDWNHDRTQVTPPPADGRNWEGRHDPRGGNGRTFDSRGRDWRDHDGRDRDGRDHDWRDRDGRDHDWRGGAWGRGPDGGPARWAPGRYPSVMWSHDRFHVGIYRPPYGYYARAWAFGDFLPRPWFAEPYWISDFIDYDLPYPPPGFVWVRVGPDALMIDEYSGRVVQVVRGIFW